MSSSISRITRGEKILQSMVTAKRLSETGKDFLVAALDPMHDTQLKELEGWPDVETSASVVRCLKQSVQFTSPLGPGVIWDCHIVQWPWLNPVDFTEVSRALGNHNVSGATGTVTLGGLQAFAVATGTAFNPLTATLVGAVYLPDAYSNGASRLVSAGFEVINTTAEIYKQGQATAYRMSQSHTVGSTYSYANPGPAVVCPVSLKQIRSPPSTMAEATLIPGTRQWLAEEGCYSVSAFVGQDNPPLLVNYLEPAIENDPTANEDRTGIINTTNLLIPKPTLIAAPFSWLFPAMKIYPIHMNGCILTGLSEQSSFALTSNLYVESFPTPKQPDILVLATPSAQYDPVALEIYSRCLGSLPTAVPSSQNGLGDWFAGVVSRAAKFLAPGLMALGQPQFAALANGAGAIADGYLASQSPQSKPRNQKMLTTSKVKQDEQNKKTKNRTKSVPNRKVSTPSNALKR